MTHFVAHYGLWVVFVVVTAEVSGLPFIPGETALIAAAVLASQGHGSIVYTIVVAVGAAVLGACIGYVIGRRWGRELLSLRPWLERWTKTPLEKSEHFFGKHGSRAVFFGRFLPILRATIGWMAGVGRMSIPKFMAWSVVGAVTWGTGMGLAAYYAGAAVIDAVEKDGGYAIAGIVVVALAVWLGMRRLERRI